ncbi:MAG TPA: N-acyl homoserine lactonase family protein [Solirubrobacterales bacterium]|nr:N-acyl homoserine lactonase family protein [Solirubrobacterales bacterium]
MKIHSIQTGTVSIKRNQVRGRGPGPLRALNTLAGRQWTKPLPILAWVIEHADGLIVVDTGETARSSDPGYFPYWQPYFKLAVRLEVQKDHEIGPQLNELGFQTADVSKVVMTHMHTDHAGGLYHFKDSEIIVSRREHRSTNHPLAVLNGYLKGRWPKWFDPTLIDLDEGPFGPFEHSESITADGTVRVVATPGHTAGHMSVIVTDDDGTQFFLAGDTSYNEQLMLERRVDGVTANGRAARRTLNAINQFVIDNRVVYLPSHDPAAPERLAGRIVCESPLDNLAAE